MMRIWMLAFVLTLGLITATATVIADDVAPKLSEVQILKIQNLAQRIEMAQMRLALAQQELEKAREAGNALVKGLQVPGYDLDLNRFVYVPSEKEKPKEKGEK